MKKLITVCMLALALLSAASANTGTRHETALSLSQQALAYYAGDYSIEALSALAGSASDSSFDAWESPLCAALHSLMNETRTGLLTYAETLTAFSQTDAGGGAGDPLRFYCDDTGSFNREQVWAEPHGCFYLDGPGRDLHHLRPADPQANSVRGDLVFGNVKDRFDSCAVWPGTGAPVFWYRGEWNGGAGLLEVRDEIKGDVARILLYVYVCYGEEGGGNRNLWTDLPACGSGMEYSDGRRVIESLDTLLAWMALDPVDTWELGRNDVVQTIQGNRNVFIDYPELAFLLFDREIPEMTTPSGWARGLQCTVSAAADPAEGGTLSVSDHTVTAIPNPGWEIDGWTLEPADAAELTREGNVFLLSNLSQSCLLTVHFFLEDPCVQGHSWDEGVVTLEPGCETAGERSFHCQVCGAVRTEPIQALGHDWHSYTIAPSCTGPGYILEACWRCGLEIETPTDPPLGHAWDEGTVIRAPTQSLPGERLYRCTRCGASYSEEIPFRFLDVSDENDYYYVPVYWALRHDPQITAGTGPNHFSPKRSCTRAQIVTFLWRTNGCPDPEQNSCPFEDVSPRSYYYLPVLWALEKGITGGTSPTSFSPNEPCTRAQAVTFLWVAAGRPEPEDPTAFHFSDVSPKAYYYQAVAWAFERGIAAGTSANSFSPDKECTRAEIVTMLWRAYSDP